MASTDVLDMSRIESGKVKQEVIPDLQKFRFRRKSPANILILGICRGEHMDVYGKAVRICLECIGIG